MANEKNLIPNSKRSPKEVRENGRKGGIASGKKRREIKSFREAAEWALNMTVCREISGEKVEITRYQQIMIDLLTMLDPDDKRFMQAAQLLHQFRNSGYVEEKLVAEIERIKADTKRISGDDKREHNGKMEELIRGLQDDIHEETAGVNENMADEQPETV